MWSPDVAEGCLRDLRRAMNVGPNAPADDPHRQLDSVGSNPLTPTKPNRHVEPVRDDRESGIVAIYAAGFRSSSGRTASARRHSEPH